MKPYLNHRTRLLALSLFLVSLLFPYHVHAQFEKPTTEIKQSTYYDAIALYYALQGIPAFPVPLNATENAKAKANWTGAGAAPDVYFKIIETISGKLLNDAVDKASLSAKLDAMRVQQSEIDPVIAEILARNDGAPAGTAASVIMQTYNDNPYIAQYTGQVANIRAGSVNGFSTSLYGSTEGLDNKGGGFGNVAIEGFVDWTIQRVNEEINDAVFVQLQKIFDKYPELRIIFPQTTEILKKTEIINYQATLNSFKVAFGKDLQQLPGNIAKLPTLKRYSDLIDKHNALILVFAVCDIASQIDKQVTPAEILQRVNTAAYLTNTGNSNIKAGISMAALTSYSLRDIKVGDQAKELKSWIDGKQLGLLKQNAKLFELFMGLYAQNAKKIVLNNAGATVSLRTEIINRRTEVLNGQFLVFNFAQAQTRISDLFGQLPAADDSKKINIGLSIAEQLINLSQVTASVLPTANATVFNNAVNDFRTLYLPMGKRAFELVGNLKAKEYSMAIFKADSLLGDIESINKNLATANNVKDISDNIEDIRIYFRKYGLLIASIAEAKTSDDVKTALNAVALPRGSSRIKKERNISFGINTYVGFYKGWNKKYKDVDLPDSETGLTVPLGFAFNFGKIAGGSLSPYVGILDVGAIFTYKVENNTTLKSDIEWSQIFSPSAGLVWGLPIISKFNIPLSIGANYQWGPRLKSVSESGNSILPLQAGHFNIFIAIDIPVINFYTSKK